MAHASDPLQLNKLAVDQQSPAREIIPGPLLRGLEAADDVHGSPGYVLKCVHGARRGNELLAGFDDALVELTAIIAWENASSKFNRALRIPSQELWKRQG